VTADDLAALAERAARIITGGGGLKALAQLLADAVDGAVLIEDDQWRHLSAAQCRGGVGPLPPTFAPHHGSAAPADGLVRAKIGDSVAALCAPMPGGAPDTAGVAGYVTLFVRGKAPSHASAALRVVAGAAGIECVRRGSGRTQARRVFWERYLAGGFVDATALRDEAAAAAVPLPPSFLAAVFDVEGAAPQVARDALAQALAAAEAVLTPVLAGPPLALFPVKNQADVARARQAATHAVRILVQQGTARSVACGVGGHHVDPLDLPVSVVQARQALTLGCRLFGRGTVTTYADLGLFALLHAGADRDDFGTFADALLEPLAAYDRKHRTDLLQTLRLYFDVGENVKEASERLSVHRHTIFYRLNQISQILKVDLKTPKDQLSVRAALAIRQMHRGEDAKQP
jgi:hypothetical protein